jgi:hypothetical protein
MILSARWPAVLRRHGSTAGPGLDPERQGRHPLGEASWHPVRHTRLLGWSLADDPSAVLLLRVWLEDDDELRARLVAATFPAGSQRTTDICAAASVGDVLTAVAAWLDAFVRDQRHR